MYSGVSNPVFPKLQSFMLPISPPESTRSPSHFIELIDSSMFPNITHRLVRRSQRLS